MYKNFKFPFFVAEISANHNGSLSQLKKLIDCAKKNGADAVKIQSYEADTISIKSKNKSMFINEGIWKGYNLWDLYKKAETPFRWHEEIFKYSKKQNILCFSTPFDESAVDILELNNCPIYKISSFEINHYPLLRKVALTRKPLIVSTGTASIQEIDKTIKFLKKYTNAPMAILYCVSNYPASKEDFNLNNLKILKKKFNCVIGLSDHSKDSIVSQLSISLGAQIIEKHIALEYQKVGPDIDFSLKGKNIKRFIDKLNESRKLIGEKKFIRKSKELKNLKYRRSIYIIKDVKKGELFDRKNIKCLRPNLGLNPSFYEKAIGCKSKMNLKKGNLLKKNHFI